MGLFEITKAGLKEREVAQFAALGLYERADLQRFPGEVPPEKRSLASGRRRLGETSVGSTSSSTETSYPRRTSATPCVS